MRVFLLFVVLVATTTDSALAGERRLTVPEAERLARAALNGEAKNLPNPYLEHPPLPPKNGAMFHVLWKDSTSDTRRVLPLLVDIDTAEVWNPNACEPLSTPSLQEAQQVIRRALHIDGQEVIRARDLAKQNGCANLVDPRPTRSDLSPAP